MYRHYAPHHPDLPRRIVPSSEWRVLSMWRAHLWNSAIRDCNVACFTSAMLHGSLLLCLAMIIPSEPASKRLQVLVFTESDLGLDLDIRDSVAFEAPAVDPVELGPRPPGSEHYAQLPVIEPTDLADPAALALVDDHIGGLDIPDAATLSRDLGELKPKRNVALRAGAKGHAELQLGGLVVPRNAAQAGAFTVFSFPADPIPNEPYWLIVQFDIPADQSVAKLAEGDVSGQLVGSDGFRMAFPGGANLVLLANGVPLAIPKPPMLRDRFTYENRRGRWAIWVPAAGGGVRDTIRVHSKLLKEHRDIELAF